MARTKARDLTNAKFLAYCTEQGIDLLSMSFAEKCAKYDDWQESLAGPKRTHTKRTVDLAIVVSHDSRDTIVYVERGVPLPGTDGHEQAVSYLRDLWNAANFAKATPAGAKDARIMVLGGVSAKLGAPAFSPVK